MATPPYTLTEVFCRRKGFDPKAPAIILPSVEQGQKAVTITYSHLHELVQSFQVQLASSYGLNTGDVVSSSLINGIEFVIAFLATGADRNIAAPLNPAYSASEVSFYLKDTSSKLLLVPAGGLSGKSASAAVKAAKELGVPIAEVIWHADKGKIELRRGGGIAASAGKKVRSPEQSDVALLLHTSGTTGRPKGVPLTHKNLTTTMRNIVNTYKLTPKDRTYLVMPLFHVHGLLCGLLATLLSGGSAVIPPRFSASRFWKDVVDHGANWYTAVPTIHQMLLNTPHPNPIPKLRFIRSCSSSLSPTTFHALEKAFKAPVLEAYAMTEAAHQMTSNPLPPAARKPGTVGLGQGVEVRILNEKGEDAEEAEVCVRGANVTPGYLNNPSANESSFVSPKNSKVEKNYGFFRTGDQGKLDKDGYLILTGRIKELINRGGEKISPLELDSALLSVKGVGEAVAFGVPDKTYGEKVWAVVVPKKEAQGTLKEEDIKNELQGKISKFKIPERVIITDAIPKTATGKIQRRNIAATFVRKEGAKL